MGASEKMKMTFRTVSPAVRRWLLVGVAFAIATIAVASGANWWVLHHTRSWIVAQPEALPVNDVGLVLGTSPKLRGGTPNPFFVGRMDLAAALYRSGQVKHLLVSGDNGRPEYDEPTAMRDALIARGVPEEAITRDFAGFRTLDTMARAQAVFGLRRCTVITDDFHLPRSLFLARAYGLDAVGCASVPVAWQWSKKTRTREVASRVVAWLDVSILGTKPKFYGPREEIVVASSQPGNQ